VAHSPVGTGIPLLLTDGITCKLADTDRHKEQILFCKKMYHVATYRTLLWADRKPVGGFFKQRCGSGSVWTALI
jgi:hypothetical protein